MIKEFVLIQFSLALTDVQEEELIKYLVSKVDEIDDLNTLRNIILVYLQNILKLKPMLKFSNDNSDLELMLKLIKAKAEKNDR